MTAGGRPRPVPNLGLVLALGLAASLPGAARAAEDNDALPVWPAAQIGTHSSEEAARQAWKFFSSMISTGGVAPRYCRTGPEETAGYVLLVPQPSREAATRLCDRAQAVNAECRVTDTRCGPDKTRTDTPAPLPEPAPAPAPTAAPEALLSPPGMLFEGGGQPSSAAPAPVRRPVQAPKPAAEPSEEATGPLKAGPFQPSTAIVTPEPVAEPAPEAEIEPETDREPEPVATREPGPVQAGPVQAGPFTPSVPLTTRPPAAPRSVPEPAPAPPRAPSQPPPAPTGPANPPAVPANPDDLSLLFEGYTLEPVVIGNVPESVADPEPQPAPVPVPTLTEDTVPQTPDHRAAFAAPAHAGALAEATAAISSGETRQAERLLGPLAEDGDPLAQYNLALLLTRRDPGRAFALMRAAADAGLAAAQNNLGILYLTGQGVARDVDAGVDWLTKAAANGHPLAKRNLMAIANTQLPVGGGVPGFRQQ